MSVKLAVIGGKKAGMEIPISTPKFLIGRGESCHIRPQSNLINYIHCQISVENDSVAIEDCSSSMGTFVNGERIKWRHSLKTGDRIKIAALEFEIQVAAEQIAVKKPAARKTPTAAPCKIALADGEEEILDWVKQEEKTRSTPPVVVTLQHAKPEKTQEPAATTIEKPVADDYDDSIEWDVIDLLLLSTIGPLVLVLLSLVPTFWIWQGAGGLVLAGLASVFCKRVDQENELKWDELNIAMCVLAMLVVSLMLPMDWLWRGGAFLLFLGLSTVVGLRMKESASSQWDEKNAALLAAIGLLLPIIVQLWMPSLLRLQLGGAIFSLAAIIGLLGFRAVRTTGFRLDGLSLLLLLLQTGILVYTIWNQLQPFQGICRDGSMHLLIGLTLLLGIRMAYRKSVKLDALNLALLVQIAMCVFVAVKLWPWIRFSEATAVVAAFLWYIGLRWRRLPKNRPDKTMLLLISLGILIVILWGFLFPISGWWPSWLNLREWPAWLSWDCVYRGWSWFRWRVLHNWWYYWWLRWGAVAFLVGVLGVLFWIRERQKA